MRRRGVAALLAMAGGFLVLRLAPAQAERHYNRVVPAGKQPSARALELHRRLRIVDLHADSMLWGRDLLQRGSRGHADVPRLLEGNVAVQGFSVVTQVPRGLNNVRNDADSDLVGWLFLAQLRPPRTWWSREERALDQARRLRDVAARSSGRLTLLERAADLDAFLARRGSEHGVLAAFLGAEGAQALGDGGDDLGRLRDAGFRMIGLTHFFDNAFAGSAHGVAKGGLTARGRELVSRMQESGMLVDLAHSSPRTIRDVLAMARRPVVSSHGGVKGTCANPRNLDDEEVRGIARTGGVVGIGYWDTAVCGDDARAVARAVRYAVDLVGADHVALGSDFDGAVTTPFDAAGLAKVTDALLDAGLTEDQVRAVMGESALRVLREALP
jgi:microsomal dipeptidase-like Zn-dependent dipeptidase